MSFQCILHQNIKLSLFTEQSNMASVLTISSIIVAFLLVTVDCSTRHHFHGSGPFSYKRGSPKGTRVLYIYMYCLKLNYIIISNMQAM